MSDGVDVLAELVCNFTHCEWAEVGERLDDGVIHAIDLLTKIQIETRLLGLPWRSTPSMLLVLSCPAPDGVGANCPDMQDDMRVVANFLTHLRARLSLRFHRLPHCHTRRLGAVGVA